jgi:hypothetical protein
MIRLLFTCCCRLVGCLLLLHLLQGDACRTQLARFQIYGTFLLTVPEITDFQSSNSERCDLRCEASKPVFWIRIKRVRIRIQHFRLYTDPNPGFDNQKLEKINS